MMMATRGGVPPEYQAHPTPPQYAPPPYTPPPAPYGPPPERPKPADRLPQAVEQPGPDTSANAAKTRNLLSLFVAALWAGSFAVPSVRDRAGEGIDAVFMTVIGYWFYRQSGIKGFP